MERHVVAGILGYVIALVVIGYAALIASVKGPVDGPSVVQGALLWGLLGAFSGVCFAEATKR